MNTGPTPGPSTSTAFRSHTPSTCSLASRSSYGRGPHTCAGKSLAEVQMALSMARVFHKLELELTPPGYLLKTKTAPTPGPAMDFKVRVKAYRH